MITLLKRFWANDSGQALSEYGLVLALVALAVIGSLVAFGDELDDIWNAIETKVKSVTISE